MASVCPAVQPINIKTLIAINVKTVPGLVLPAFLFLSACLAKLLIY